MPIGFDPSITFNTVMIFTKQGDNCNKLSFTFGQNFVQHFEIFQESH